MDPIQFPENLAELSTDDLASLASNARAALGELFAAVGDGAPTVEQAGEAERLASGLEGVDAELSARSERANNFAALREQFGNTGSEDPAAQEAAKGEGKDEVNVDETDIGAPERNAREGMGDPHAEGKPELPEGDPTKDATGGEGPSNKASRVDPTRVAGRRPTAAPAAAEVPSVPARRGTLTMTASADVPGIATGAAIADVDQLAELVMAKIESFPKPQGNGKGQDFRYFGLATLHKNIPDHLKITDRMAEDPMEVIKRAVDIHMLELQTGRTGAEALVAAGGWCTPSEVTYDISSNESTDGLYSLPEVGLGRGGLKHTLGPDWSDIYSQTNYFHMTEADAIAGTYTKPCVTLQCPTWVDDRLDAVGLCVKAPFLTEAAYPELVKRWISGSNVAYQIKKSLAKLAAVEAALETAETATDFTSTYQSLMVALDVIGTRERQKRSLPRNQVFELVLPEWVLTVLRNDLAFRQGVNPAQISDQQITQGFTQRGFAPQFIRGFQPLWASSTDNGRVAYPATFDVLAYPAGTFVSGTNDVVNLQTVYDAASLADNVYTALFFEEGMNVMRMGYGGVRVTVPVCVSGHVGSANAAVCGTAA